MGQAAVAIQRSTTEQQASLYLLSRCTLRLLATVNANLVRRGWIQILSNGDAFRPNNSIICSTDWYVLLIRPDVTNDSWKCLSDVHNDQFTNQPAMLCLELSRDCTECAWNTNTYGVLRTHFQARACCGLITYVLVSNLSCHVRAVMYLSCLKLRFSYVQIANLTEQVSWNKWRATWSQKKKQEIHMTWALPLEKSTITEVGHWHAYGGTYSVY